MPLTNNQVHNSSYSDIHWVLVYYSDNQAPLDSLTETGIKYNGQSYGISWFVHREKLLCGFLVITKSKSYLLTISFMKKSSFPPILQSAQSVLMSRWHLWKSIVIHVQINPKIRGIKILLDSLPNSYHREKKFVFELRRLIRGQKGQVTTLLGATRVWDRAMLLLELSWVIMWLLKRFTCFPSFLIGWNHSCNMLKLVRASKLFSCKSKTGLDSNELNSTRHKLHILIWFPDRRQSLQK